LHAHGKTTKAVGKDVDELLKRVKGQIKEDVLSYH